MCTHTACIPTYECRSVECACLYICKLLNCYLKKCLYIGYEEPLRRAPCMGVVGTRRAILMAFIPLPLFGYTYHNP